ncbi:hypothetical protein [Streptomyces celluloflavus]|uniref:hypothetical protein n=1 Tax=Streptomyces celluloflavus TaxID=58344 RepID=UPI00368A54E3
MSMMPDAAGGGRLPLGEGSPFDAIRRVDERGEYWSWRARHDGGQLDFRGAA